MVYLILGVLCVVSMLIFATVMWFHQRRGKPKVVYFIGDARVLEGESGHFVADARGRAVVLEVARGDGTSETITDDMPRTRLVIRLDPPVPRTALTIADEVAARASSPAPSVAIDPQAPPVERRSPVAPRFERDLDIHE